MWPKYVAVMLTLTVSVQNICSVNGLSRTVVFDSKTGIKPHLIQLITEIPNAINYTDT